MYNPKLLEKLQSIFNETPIYIATKCIQRRTHKKWRTNKKWAKRYGYTELNYMPIGQPMYIDGMIWMTKRDFDYLMENIK